MAHVIPPKLAEGSPESEVALHEALSTLSDDWVVICQVGVTRRDRRGERRDGEADFVLLHPAFGLLVIEAKGGAYQARGRRWFRWEPDEWIEMPRSPIEQAKTNKYSLVDFLTDNDARPLSTGWAVAFTSGQPSGMPGPDAARQLLLGPADLNGMSEAVDQVVHHWGMTRGWEDDSAFRRAVALLAPDVDVSSDSAAEVELQRGALDRLFRATLRFTEDQLNAQRVCGGVSRMAVLGPAGTGKTLLARVRANALAEAGYRTALVSDRWGVSSELASLAPLHSSVVAGTPAEVVQRLHGAPVPDGPEMLAGAVASLWGAASAPGALVVDEAQSLPADLLQALMSAMAETAPIYIYGDPYQRDSDALWRPPGLPEVWVTTNCRNSESITRVLTRLSGAHYSPQARTSRQPTLLEVDHAIDIAPVAAEISAREAQAVGAHRVAVLTDSRTLTGVRLQLRSRDVPTRTSPDSLGVALQTPDGFRGGEADVVVYVRTGSSARDDYVALSRARVRAHVVTERGTWEHVRHLFAPEETA